MTQLEEVEKLCSNFGWDTPMVIRDNGGNAYYSTADRDNEPVMIEHIGDGQVNYYKWSGQETMS